MYGTECHRGLWALTISLALCPRKACDKNHAPSTEMAFTNLRPAVDGAPPAADDEQHYLLIFDSHKNSSWIRRVQFLSVSETNMSAKRYHQRSAEGFVLWGLFLCVGLGFGLCAIGLLTLFKTVNPFRCCPPLWNYGSAVMYGRLYEVGNSLRLLFNCGCSVLQITFR